LPSLVDQGLGLVDFIIQFMRPVAQYGAVQLQLGVGGLEFRAEIGQRFGLHTLVVFNRPVNQTLPFRHDPACAAGTGELAGDGPFSRFLYVRQRSFDGGNTVQ
jgi:hypothetical protein